MVLSKIALGHGFTASANKKLSYRRIVAAKVTVIFGHITIYSAAYLARTTTLVSSLSLPTSSFH